MFKNRGVCRKSVVGGHKDIFTVTSHHSKASPHKLELVIDIGAIDCSIFDSSIECSPSHRSKLRRELFAATKTQDFLSWLVVFLAAANQSTSRPLVWLAFSHHHHHHHHPVEALFSRRYSTTRRDCDSDTWLLLGKLQLHFKGTSSPFSSRYPGSTILLCSSSTRTVY